MRLPLGKVPPPILEQVVFKHLGAARDDIVFGPSRGEDAGIVRIGKKLLAVHCDPISGAYSRIGWIAINVGTNDIATRGILPRWVVTCILLPEGADERLLQNICKDMDEAAKKLGVGIIGGHAEVTLGLNRPVVVVHPIGVAKGERYVTCQNMRPGGKIVLTKSVAIEGTAILAHDREEAIRKKFGEDFLARAKAYFDHLSILKEAMIAFRAGGVMSMHDPTEGGLAGGLNEMADAAGVGFEVYDENIPIAPETKELCRLFKINPLALISSGSLLIVAEQEMSEDIVRRIRKAGIQANIIGKVCADSRRRVIIKSGRQEKWLPMPHSDELWIALSRRVD